MRNFSVDRFKSWVNGALVFYSAHLPYHRGKWRIVEKVVRLSGLESYYLGKSFVVHRQGIWWRLYPECIVQRSVYLYGDWESSDTCQVLKLLKPDWVIFDIGSYFGYYALLACRHSGPRGKVFAFEPFSQNYNFLCENKRLNAFNNLTTINLAVTDRKGVQTFRVPPTFNQGSGGLAGTEHGALYVQTTTLDDFVHNNHLTRLDFIKMDVEGSEVLALAGGKETIQRFQPILMIELDPGKLNKLNQTPQGLIRAISDLGYKIYRVTEFGLERFQKADGVNDFINLFCFPDTYSRAI